MRQEVKLCGPLPHLLRPRLLRQLLSSSLDSVIADMSPPEEFPEESEKENVPISPHGIIRNGFFPSKTIARSAFVITGAVLIGLAAVAVLAAILWRMLKRFCWGIVKEQER